MQVPLQITFRRMPRSPALERRVRALATRLEKFSPNLVHCHVVIEKPHRHQQQGEHFDVRIELGVPGPDIIVSHCRAADGAHEDPYVVLRDAFRAARRKLQDYERLRRHEVKAHAETTREPSPGTEVKFAEEHGEQGPQASTIHVA